MELGTTIWVSQDLKLQDPSLHPIGSAEVKCFFYMLAPMQMLGHITRTYSRAYSTLQKLSNTKLNLQQADTSHQQ